MTITTDQIKRTQTDFERTSGEKLAELTFDNDKFTGIGLSELGMLRLVEKYKYSLDKISYGFSETFSSHYFVLSI